MRPLNVRRSGRVKPEIEFAFFVCRTAPMLSRRAKRQGHAKIGEELIGKKSIAARALSPRISCRTAPTRKDITRRSEKFQVKAITR
jgi:hypothetical protein